jgi:hypothetical protein
VSIIPIEFFWNGEAMVPIDRFIPVAERQYTKGEVYRLAVEEERSAISHRHYFASVNEAWKNLPHDIAPLFPTAEKLRKWALIKTGYATEQAMVVDTEIDAARMANLLGRMNEDSVVVAKGRVMKMYTAKSQSTRSMDKKEFQTSKTAVLDLLSEMIGTSRETLEANAGKAA